MDKKISNRKILYVGLPIGLVAGLIFYLMYKNITVSLAFVIAPVLIFLFLYFKGILDRLNRIAKIESVFPDFLQLMASNLRAGMTTDRAIFLSARKEFSPLDEEIQKTARNVTMGKTLEFSLIDMSKRIESKKIEKVILLISSSIKSGGNLATLLEETSIDMREKDFIEKKAVSNINMYIIFIFLAAAIGAPALFSLSNMLVSILTKIFADLPSMNELASTSIPLAFSKIDISITFITYFSVIFIICTDLMASLIIGLISKGEEKQGLNYFIPLTGISLSVFFVSRIVLEKFLLGMFF